MTRYRTASVQVEVGLDEFDDDEIVDEVVHRGLQGKVFAELNPAASAAVDEVCDPKEAAEVALSDLMCRRTEHAKNNLRATIAMLVPPSLLAALEALDEGRVSDAICELDDFIRPGPAATATSLPPRAPLTATAGLPS